MKKVMKFTDNTPLGAHRLHFLLCRTGIHLHITNEE